MNPWHQRVERRIARALRAAERLPSSTRGPFEQGLAYVARMLAQPGTPPANVEAALRQLMAQQLAVATQGRIGAAPLASLGEVFNAALGRPDREIRLREIVLRRPPALPLLVASRERPVAKTVARTLFAYTQVLTFITEAGAKPKPADEKQRGVEEVQRSAIAELAAREDATVDEEARDAAPVRMRATGEAITPREYSERMVEWCAENVALFARNRARGPWRHRRIEEERILQQIDAICAAGGDCVGRLARWWAPLREHKDPWRAWAATFALGVIEGPDALDAVGRGLERLPAHAIGETRASAEALLVIPHKELVVLCRDLLSAPHPLARAAAIDVLSTRKLLAPEDLDRHLLDVNAAVLAAALRALPRLLPEPTPVIDRLPPLMAFPDANVAWEAARTLALWGRADPCYELRRGGRIGTILSPERTIDLLAMLGDDTDLPFIQSLVARSVVTPGVLHALARYGHAGSRDFLLHFLEDPSLAEPAADALITLFGPRVASDSKTSPAAWRAALERWNGDPALRFRGGEPWHPRVLARECIEGHLARDAIQHRLDELTARSREVANIDLRLWSSDVDPSLNAFLDRVARHGRTKPGTWER